MSEMKDDEAGQSQGNGQDKQNPPAIPPPPTKPETQTERTKAEEGANVALSGKAEPITVDGDLNIGMHDTIKLPSEAQQRAGFKCEKWSVLVNQFPDRYKVLTPRTTEGQESNDNGESNDGGNE